MRRIDQLTTAVRASFLIALATTLVLTAMITAGGSITLAALGFAIGLVIHWLLLSFLYWLTDQVALEVIHEP